MTASRGNRSRRRAGQEPAPAVEPPLPVDPSHPCWCGKPGRPVQHRIGWHYSFWENPPKQGVKSR